MHLIKHHTHALLYAGFWLSLAAVPFFMIIGGSLAGFAAQSSPVRYYAVVEPGSTLYADAIEAEFQRREEADRETASELAAQMDMTDQASAQIASSQADRKFIRVPAPAAQLRETSLARVGYQTTDGRVPPPACLFGCPRSGQLW